MLKVSRSGQVTIPAKVRQALSIRPGDRVLFELEPNGAHLRVVKPTALTDLYAALEVERSPRTKRPSPTPSSEEEAVGAYLGELDRRTYTRRQRGGSAARAGVSGGADASQCPVPREVPEAAASRRAS